MGKKFLQKKAKEAKKQSEKKPFDMGIIAASSKLIKKAKTHKGRKFIEKRAPQLIEGKKTAIFIRGKKCSQVIQDLMREMIQLRGEPENSRVFMRNGHEILPFENIVPLESMSSKQDCALFCFGNHQKKRPDNIVLGRTYDSKSLDLFELGIENYKSIVNFATADIPRDLKPVLIFQGEHFEFSERHQRLKNFFYELFRQRDLKEANITEMKRVLVFTSINETTIQVRHYEVQTITESLLNLEFKEIGPHFDLKFRRHQIASADLYKIACKKPKITNMEKKKAKKNVYTTELGERKGKVFIQHQDL